MAVASVRAEPVQPSEQETRQAQIIDLALRARATRSARLVAPTGQQFDLPDALDRAIRQAVRLLAQGRAVAIVPYDTMLTTQQAADLLNVSRPYLIRLLEGGHVPFHRVGTHRRIRFDDLMRYRAQRDAERRHHLARLTRLSQDLGLYAKR